MKFVNQLYYLLSAYEAIQDAVASPKDYGQALQNSNRRRKGGKR